MRKLRILLNRGQVQRMWSKSSSILVFVSTLVETLSGVKYFFSHPIIIIIPTAAEKMFSSGAKEVRTGHRNSKESAVTVRGLSDLFGMLISSNFIMETRSVRAQLSC